MGPSSRSRRCDTVAGSLEGLMPRPSRGNPRVAPRAPGRTWPWQRRSRSPCVGNTCSNSSLSTDLTSSMVGLANSSQPAPTAYGLKKSIFFIAIFASQLQYSSGAGVFCSASPLMRTPPSRSRTRTASTGVDDAKMWNRASGRGRGVSSSSRTSGSRSVGPLSSRNRTRRARRRAARGRGPRLGLGSGGSRAGGPSLRPAALG